MIRTTCAASLLIVALASSVVLLGARSAGQQAVAAPLRERLNRIGTDVFTRPDRVTAAIRELKEILAAEPELSEAHLLLGIAYRSSGSPEMVGEARAELVQAVSLDPANVPARYYLANLYLELGRAEKAKEELETGLAQAPGRPQFLALLGEAERQLKNPQRAVELTRQALAPDESFAQARYYLALALSDIGQRLEAVKELERVVAAAPPMAEPYLSLAMAYADGGRLDEALGVLGKGLQIDRTRADLRLQMARVYRLKGLPLKADQQLTLAMPAATGPASSSYGQQHLDADFYLEKGLLRLQQGRLTAAAEALQKVLDMDPDQGPANRALAELYLRRGAYARAAEYAARAAKLGFPLSVQNTELIQSRLRGAK